MNTAYVKTIKPTQNLAFKKLFASKGNEDILAGLIEDFFGFAADLLPEYTGGIRISPSRRLEKLRTLRPISRNSAGQ